MNIKDQVILTELAKWWVELAYMTVMQDKKRQWKALKDLKQEKPMILVEVDEIERFVLPQELECEDSFMRGIELELKKGIRHAEEVGDDFLLEPYYSIPWDIKFPDYGVAVDIQKGEDSRGEEKSWGFVYSHPIKKPEDIDKLKARQFSVDRAATLRKKELLENVFDGILPVKTSCSQYSTHCLIGSISNELFKLMGMEDMFLWMYDEPDALHRILKYIQDDRISMFDWMLKEGLLSLNNESMFIGSGSPGYTNDLPAPDYNGEVRFKDLWLWTESQETSTLSPKSFCEFYLPYMAEVAKRFGLVYYGCCEPVHDIWEYIYKAIPNIRAVSISPWCDVNKIAGLLGKDAVFSRKTHVTSISGKSPDWSIFEKDVSETVNAARDCNLEFIFRDIIDINGDRSRLPKMVQITRRLLGE